ncbi:hypothetical protein P43SY_001041 [Pythium insidiosum]|uniref:Apple domain-containing protein n=1 Tax=Pythium insidiosum TaxID=114742 RepID=A0AAD5LTG3_PYTIN|nr:hypothetical protein P43SY_001041 [Pythium insidiosum]
MMNSTAVCPFATKAMFAYMHPIEHIAMSRHCNVSIHSPEVKRLSDEEKKTYCECHPYVRVAFENFDLPTCKTSSGVSYTTMTLRFMKFALTSSAVYALLVATALHGMNGEKVIRVGTLCDMTKLEPILNGDDMKQCTSDSDFVIPKIAAYDRGYERVPEKVCTSAACGKVITAIKALGLSECDLAKEVSSGNTIEVTLFNRHVDPVVTLCGSDSSSFGARPNPDPDAMDDSKPCTQNGIASYFWDQRSTLEECVGTKLTSLVASDSSSSRAVDVVEEYTVCPACAKIKAAIETSKIKIPTCQLTGRGTCFSKHLEYAFSYCEALVDLNNGKTPAEVLSQKVMNSSVTCRFGSRPMNAYLSPVENELFASEKCSALLYNPTKKLSDDAKKTWIKMTGFSIIAILLTLLSFGDGSMLRQESKRQLETMKYMEAMLSPPRPACYIENGFDYVGNDIGNFPARVDKCCDECAQFSGCNAWSWSNYNGGTCWFKSARGDIVVNKDVKSSLLFRGGYQLCQKIYDTDFVDNDIGNQPSASADGCCDICHDQAIYKPGVISAQAYPSRPDPHRCL